jgi:hypothetical protein
MDVVRVIAGEEEDKYRRAALVLRTLGWFSIVWGCGIAMWIWTGLKAGSNLWLWWTIGQFVFGAICLVAASRLRVHAAQQMRAAPEAEIRDRAA